MPQPPVALCIIRDFQLLERIGDHLRAHVLDDQVIGATTYPAAAAQLTDDVRKRVHLVIADQPMAAMGIKDAYGLLNSQRVGGIAVMSAAKAAQLSPATHAMMREAGVALLDPAAPNFYGDLLVTRHKLLHGLPLHDPRPPQKFTP